MKLLINKTTRAIHDASNLGAWRNLPNFLEIVDAPGDANPNSDGTFKFPWPNAGGPSGAMLSPDGQIIANPAWSPDPRPARVAALKGKIDALALDPTVPQGVKDFATALKAIL